jgi:hypothetical protein
MLERYAHPSGAEMSRAVRVLTAYTTGTKTGTATKNGNGDPQNADAASAVKSGVTKWRPQCPAVGTRSPVGSSRSTACGRRPERLRGRRRGRTVGSEPFASEVEKGLLIVDEPTTLPEGSVIDLVAEDERDSLTTRSAARCTPRCRNRGRRLKPAASARPRRFSTSCGCPGRCNAAMFRGETYVWEAPFFKRGEFGFARGGFTTRESAVMWPKTSATPVEDSHRR